MCWRQAARVPKTEIALKTDLARYHRYTKYYIDTIITIILCLLTTYTGSMADGAKVQFEGYRLINYATQKFYESACSHVHVPLC